MRTKVIILVLLLSISQAYAWGDRERGLLLGFISGIAVSNVYQSHRSGNSHVRIKSRAQHHDHRPQHRRAYNKHDHHVQTHSHIRQSKHQRDRGHHRREHRDRR